MMRIIRIILLVEAFFILYGYVRGVVPDLWGAIGLVAFALTV